MFRLDQPCQRLSGAMDYFSMHMKTGDYLTQSGQSEMVWVGQGSEMLGLHGQVDREEFERLCKGQHPFSGEKLTVRDKGKIRRICFFGQMSAPKDVSIALLVGGDERIKDWWEEAIQETVREIESTVQTRVRKGGAVEDRTTRNMVAAIVTHESSRSLDPQLHTHVCIMNVTYDPIEKRWKSIQPSSLYRYQSYFREVCYNKLAGRMIAAGYELEKSRVVGFNIVGFPAALRQRFSKRREQIDALAKELGITDQDGLQRIATYSRDKKKLVAVEQLQEKWKVECGDELSPLRQVIASATGSPKPHLVITAADALAYAEEHVFERSSVTDERILLREALSYGRGEIDLTELQNVLDQRVKSGALLRRNELITCRELLTLEHECIEWVYVGRGKHRPFGDGSVLDPSLSVEQLTAARKILDSRDRAIVFQGDAGTGKTSTLKEIIKGLVQTGGRPFACAPSSNAAEVLRKELTADADTLQQLLVNQELQRRFRGQVIIVDEAGLVSTRQMHALFRVAHENRNRLILVGDVKQHTSVEAGDALRSIQLYGNLEVATLRTIRRQKNAGYRKAVEFLARHKAYQAFEQFEALGCVRDIANPAKLFAAAANDYVKTVSTGKTCLAISPVWSEIHQFTNAVRSKLKDKQLLHSEEHKVVTFRSFQWTKALKKDVRNYQSGDVLLFHRKSAVFAKDETVKWVATENERLVVERANGERYAFNPKAITSYEVGAQQEIAVAIGERVLIRGNHKPSQLQNGDIVEVAGFGQDNALRLKDGREIPSMFQQFTYGYATTSHAAQGKTVDRGILMMSDAGIHAGNLKQAYVSNSRFRESQAIYVSNRDDARNAMATPADRQLAMELMEQRRQRGNLFRRILEMADAWAHRRKLALAAWQSQQSKQKVNLHV